MKSKLAIEILKENSKVLYGIFGEVESSNYFPPRVFLNEFLMQGNDPCDQDGRMDNWQPFEVSDDEYISVLNWWIENKSSNAKVEDLGVNNWNDWAVELIEME